MVPDTSTREKLALEHRHTLLGEADMNGYWPMCNTLFLIRCNVLQEDLACT
ncbi:MAG: hypothetical protein ACR2H5_01075 [Ktedonobacteraceae bacterium]